MSSTASNTERNTNVFGQLPILIDFLGFIKIIINYLITYISGYFTSSSPELNTIVGDDTQWGLTQTKVVKCSYTWTIDNFELSSKDVYEQLESPTFSIESNGNITWRLVMHLWKKDIPKFPFIESNQYLGLYLKLVSSQKTSVRANYKFSILNEKLTESNVVESQKYRYLNLTTEYGSDKFIRKLTLEKSRKSLLPKDKLTIRCEVSILEDRVNISGKDELRNITCCLSDDVCKLFKNMKLSDVTLVASGKEIRAHKAILAARSTVFAAMFEHDMLEQKLSRVNITDVDHDVLTEVLRYIYTDRVPNLDKMASHLLIVADKYALDSLKGLCEMVLCRNISVETAADILVLADLCSVVRLKTQVIAFINTHASQVKDTAGWKNMITTHPHLVAELFLALTVQRKQR